MRCATETHVSEMGTDLEMRHVVPYGVHTNHRNLWRASWALLVESVELGRYVFPYWLELPAVGTRWHVKERQASASLLGDIWHSQRKEPISHPA